MVGKPVRQVQLAGAVVRQLLPEQAPRSPEAPVPPPPGVPPWSGEASRDATPVPLAQHLPLSILVVEDIAVNRRLALQLLHQAVHVHLLLLKLLSQQVLGSAGGGSAYVLFL